MSFPQVIAVATSSPADLAGVIVGDEIRLMNGVSPRDVIEYQFLADEAEVTLELDRGGLGVEVLVEKHAGEPLGIEVSSAVFDRVRTCDNHCEFCFIYQLPKGLRKSFYVKDDDYRLSFLYGNFTTLTRFTEFDLERVVSQRLSPLFVSIHATNPEVRGRMVKNRRGATSLRWLRALLDNDITVHGQIVCCPGVNDGPVLEDTLAGVLERFSELCSVAVVPLGVSRYSKEAAMRPHLVSEAEAVLDTVTWWQDQFLAQLGRRVVFAADEYYLLANRDIPAIAHYEAPAEEENGVGMSARFAESFETRRGGAHRGGFFQAIDGAPAIGYRAPRAEHTTFRDDADVPTTIITGRYGAQVLRPLLDRNGFSGIAILTVENHFFGGNIGVSGLLSGVDIASALADAPPARYLLPDVCLSNGRFLDGLSPEDLPQPVQIVETTGAALRRALSAKASSRSLQLSAS